MARLKFGAEKRHRFPYWVVPTVIFVFGVGMLAGRAMESNLTLAELRDTKLSVSDLFERLWPKRDEARSLPPARSVMERTEEENRLKSENARLLTEKDALVEQVQTLKNELRTREQSLQGVREEVKKLAASNRELADLSKEYEELKQKVALEEEAKKQQADTGIRTGSPVAAPRKKSKSRALAPEERDRVAQGTSEPARGPSYQVLRRTPILRNPSESAQILYYLSPGRRVNVGGIVNGRFVRVQYSRSGNPPGYVLVKDVVPLE